jgi:hypothetical protein
LRRVYRWLYGCAFTDGVDHTCNNRTSDGMTLPEIARAFVAALGTQLLIDKLNREIYAALARSFESAQQVYRLVLKGERMPGRGDRKNYCAVTGLARFGRSFLRPRAPDIPWRP